MSKDNKNNMDQETEEQLQEEVKEESVNLEENQEETAEIQEEQEIDELEQLKTEKKELNDKFLRLFAEFENFKKRTFKEKVETLSTAAKDTLVSLLPILDDFDRAKLNAEDENSKEPFSEGVNMVYNKLYSTLKGLGLQEMVTNGEAFNPDFHEAITEIPAPDEEMKGKIIDTVLKGYKLKDKIIRHAKVVVGK